MLNILENFHLGGPPRVTPLSRSGRGAGGEGGWPPEAVHLVIEAMRRAYCDRARYLGDADFVAVPPHLTSKDYARKLAAEIDPAKATPSETLAPEIPLAAESPETTHFSVIDPDGMAVANTYTLENGYGSRVMVRGAGFLLNNEMTDFNRVPGRTDRKGSIGTEANLIAPGKRMLSSQTPTLVCREGRLVLVTGSPGGRTIINTVLCTIVNLVDYRMDVRRAVDAPRLHHQWFPDRIRLRGAQAAAVLGRHRAAQAHGTPVQSQGPQARRRPFDLGRSRRAAATSAPPTAASTAGPQATEGSEIQDVQGILDRAFLGHKLRLRARVAEDEVLLLRLDRQVEAIGLALGDGRHRLLGPFVERLARSPRRDRARRASRARPFFTATVTQPSPKNFRASRQVASSPVTMIGGTPKCPAIAALWASSPDSTPLYQYRFSVFDDCVWWSTPSGVPIMA